MFVFLRVERRLLPVDPVIKARSTTRGLPRVGLGPWNVSKVVVQSTADLEVSKIQWTKNLSVLSSHVVMIMVAEGWRIGNKYIYIWLFTKPL